MLFQIGLIDPNHGGHRSRFFNVEAESEEAFVVALGLKREKIGVQTMLFFHSAHGKYIADICRVAAPTPINELKKKLDEGAQGLWAWGAGD